MVFDRMIVTSQVNVAYWIGSCVVRAIISQKNERDVNSEKFLLGWFVIGEGDAIGLTPSCKHMSRIIKAVAV